MSDNTLKAILVQVATVPTYTPPVSAYKLGKEAFRRGNPLKVCITDEMTAGWLAAENEAAWSYFNGMAAEGLAGLAVSL